MPVWLQYTPWRVSCSRCGVKVERVPWADGSSVFTAAFEESAAYLAQVTDRTPVSRLLGISWVAGATSWNASSLGGLTELGSTR